VLFFYDTTGGESPPYVDALEADIERGVLISGRYPLTREHCGTRYTLTWVVHVPTMLLHCAIGH
jgi:hypothetical protein